MDSGGGRGKPPALNDSNNKAQGSDGRWMLKLIYPHATSLEVYLERWLRDIVTSAPSGGSISSAAIESFGNALSYLIREDDGPDFKLLLKETLVAYQAPAAGVTVAAPVGGDDHAPLPRHAALHHRSSMADLLDRVIKSLLSSSFVGQGGYYAAQGDDPRRNVLSLGCRVAGPQARSELLSVQGVACAFPNTTVNIIRSPPWELLLSRIGDDLMFALLRQHVLLLRMPNRCYLQLAGRPVPDLCRHLRLTSGATHHAAGSSAPSRNTSTQDRRSTSKPFLASGNRGSVRASTTVAEGTKHQGDTLSLRGIGELARSERTNYETRTGDGATASNVPALGAGDSSCSSARAKGPGSHIPRAPTVSVGPGRAESISVGPVESGVRGGGSVAQAAEGKRGRVEPVLLLPRQRIFYSSTFVRKAGLPRGHPLNPCTRSTVPAARTVAPSNSFRGHLNSAPLAKFPPSNNCSKKTKAGEATKAARYLLTDVFCRGNAVAEHRPPWTDGTDGIGPNGHKKGPRGKGGKGREGKAGGGCRRLPKRLCGALPLFEEVIQRAGRCNFGRLLEAHCPLPQGFCTGKRRRSRGRGEIATLPGGVPGKDVVGILPTKVGTHRQGEEERGTFAWPMELDMILSQEMVMSDTSTEKELDFEESMPSVMTSSQCGQTGGGDDGGVLGVFGRGMELAGGGDYESASVADSVAFEYSVASLSLPSPPLTVKSSQGSNDNVVSSATRGGHRARDGGEDDDEVLRGPAKRRRRMSVDSGAAESAASFGYKDVAGDLAAGAPTSSEHIEDGASDVTVMEMDMDNGSDHDRHDQRGGGMEEGRRGDLEAVNGEKGTSARQPPSSSNSTGAPALNPPLEFRVDFNFIEMASGHQSVVDFLCQACHRVFPTALWGSKRNMICLFRAVERFVVLRRHENMTLLEVMAGMKTSDLEWMSPHPHQPNHKDTSKMTVPSSKDDSNLPQGPEPSAVPPKKTNTPRSAVNPTQTRAPAGCGRGSEGNRRAEGGRAMAGKNAGSGQAPRSEVVPASCGRSAASKALRGKGKGKERGIGKGRRKGGRDTCNGSARKEIAGDAGAACSRRGNRRARSMMPPSDLAKRTALLEALVYWTFNDFIVPLLRALFYVTECETSSQEVFFFRKPVWAKFRTVSLRHLTAKQYKRITAQEAFCSTATNAAANNTNTNTNGNLDNGNSNSRNGRDQDRTGRRWAFPVSGVRLVPKVNGVRPITNLSKRAWADRDGVQWVKGIPLPGPRRPAAGLHRTASIPTPNAGNVQLGNNSNADGAGRGKDLRRSATYPGAGTGASGFPTLFQGVRGERGAGGGGGGSGAGGVVGNGNGGVLLPSTNMQLSNAFHVLKHEYLNKPSLVGAGVFGLDDVFAKIKPFVARNLRPLPFPSQTVAGGHLPEKGRRERARGRGGGKREGVSVPPLFFASIDIKHCYDAIDQARLMEIVRRVITSEDYVVQKYSKTHPFKAMGRVQVAHVKEAVAMEDMSQFRQLCEGLAAESVDTIFTDQVVYGITSRDNVLEMIEDHITNNVVRVPAAGGSGKGAYFRQAVGIPQGSVLSGLLCNYFFGHIEKCLLGDVLLLSPPPLASTTVFPRVETPVHTTGTRGLGHDPDRPLQNRVPGDNDSGGCGGMDQRVTSNRNEDGSKESLHQIYERAGASARKPGGAVEDDSESDCVLLRQVDDFLLVTTSKKKAEAFVRVMHDTSKTGPWGFSVHETKTLVNFDMRLEEAPGEPVRKIRQIEGTLFPWCGVRFDTKTCEVIANYSRFFKSSVSESVTVESRRAGECLVAKMKRFMSPKCHALMLDEGEFGVNSRQTVLLNVYEMMLVCAAKTAASALRLPRGPGGNGSLLSNGAIDTTSYAYSLIQSRSNRRKGGFGTSKGLQCVCKIHRFEVTWLGLHAFREVFSAFSTKHRGFTSPKLAMHHALLEAEKVDGLGGKEVSRQGEGDAREGEAQRGRKAKNPQLGVIRDYARLRKVVGSSDAICLLQTLTSGE